MNREISSSLRSKIISVSCLIVLGVIAIAGLWPFHAPHNEVRWLPDNNGLSFSGYGSAISIGAFRASRPSRDVGRSIEVLLKPAKTKGDGSILAFDSSADPQAPFLLRQYGTTLVVQRYLADDHGNVVRPWSKVEHVLEDGKQVFVTVTSSRDTVAVYVDGVLARRFSDPGIGSGEFSGRLVLANSTVDDSWTGQIMGLAVYGRELTPAEVGKHFESWTSQQEPPMTAEQSLTALYVFNERSGNIVHNQVDQATNLVVPDKYFVLHPSLLLSTRAQYSFKDGFWERWSFWEDLGVNIAGFVPVGFVFLAYFSSVRRIARPALVVVIGGLFLSFTVEVLQSFLPTRDSGMTDLLTNTAGTGLGVLLYRSTPGQALWEKALDWVSGFLGRAVSPQ